ncbi:helix-turn-helix domain-containing protein [Nocardioides sp.]|uniref:winged helix-turn-helix transcriptional regulator n=1 Tax=Nocardioides sp. TaxID=35761 RepID=UPI0031FF18CE|nr:putative HxlR-family transcriptional regulator [Nocardioides sp.]
MSTMTADQRRAVAKQEFDAFMAACPSRALLDVIANKWVCLVLGALADGPRRHGELRRQIAGISQKMLTQTLRELERDGLVTREVTASVPVRVDYEMTELGNDLQRVVHGLKVWAEDNMAKVLEHRALAESG